MIRAGFLAHEWGTNWLGGVHYFKNLLGALREAPEVGVLPVLITRTGVGADPPSELGMLEVVRTPALRRWTPSWLVDRVHSRVGGHTLLLERALQAHDVQLLSHLTSTHTCRGTPTIAWIPDFQHRYLPELFAPRELAARDSVFARLSARSRLVIVSSQAAREDLSRFHPGAAAKARVLRFVADPSAPAEEPDLAGLQTRYGFSGPYLHLPNQFWAHKNHRLVIDALAILSGQRRAVRVLATGNTRDYRRPAFMQELTTHLHRSGVEDAFRILGLVPQADLAALFRHARAVINPSLFEGWSTTVEEAKSLGKRVLLSDIPVHREQAPPAGVFFDPRDPSDLAAKMWEVWSAHVEDEETERAAAARAALPARRRAFAAEYAAIAREALGC